MAIKEINAKIGGNGGANWRFSDVVVPLNHYAADEAYRDAAGIVAGVRMQLDRRQDGEKAIADLLLEIEAAIRNRTTDGGLQPVQST